MKCISAKRRSEWTQIWSPLLPWRQSAQLSFPEHLHAGVKTDNNVQLTINLFMSDLLHYNGNSFCCSTVGLRIIPHLTVSLGHLPPPVIIQQTESTCGSARIPNLLLPGRLCERCPQFHSETAEEIKARVKGTFTHSVWAKIVCFRVVNNKSRALRSSWFLSLFFDSTRFFEKTSQTKPTLCCE